VPYLVLSLFLTACGTTDSSNQIPKPEDPRPKISQSTFDAALSKVTFIVDEFDGSWEIFGSPEEQNAFTKSSGPRNSRYALVISLYIVRASSDAPVDARASIDFLATECMNIYQWDVKSNIGVVNFDFESDLRECDLAEGYSDVINESAKKYMSKSEMLNYCEIIRGKDITFRVVGFDGILSHKGSMPKTAISIHKNICVVYQGLLDGLSPNLT
jgi:hypothetical protein